MAKTWEHPSAETCAGRSFRDTSPPLIFWLFATPAFTFPEALRIHAAGNTVPGRSARRKTCTADDEPRRLPVGVRSRAVLVLCSNVSRNEPKPAKKRNAETRVIIGSCRCALVPVAFDFALITQRSEVQILPPQLGRFQAALFHCV